MRTCKPVLSNGGNYMRNLVNFVAKAYTGILVIVFMISLIVEKGVINTEILSVVVVTGMMLGFGIIMIGDLVLEIKAYYKKWKLTRDSQKDKKVVKEAAQ